MPNEPKVQLSIKYRPTEIGKLIVGNPDVLVEAAQQLDAQAILLEGETGSGKTTLARAMALAINGNTIDLICDPASSNNGVDYYRTLQERLKYAPSRKKWIVVIDEAHGLSKDAFKALLTLIETPPHKHVLFILCTNHGYALPKEAFNRCIKLTIDKPTAEQAIPYLANVLFKEVPFLTSKQERRKLANKAIVDAEFCMREAMQNLDSYCAKLRGKIKVSKILGITSKKEGGEARDNIEQAAGNILAAIRDSADGKRTNDAITYVLVTFSQHDPHALMARIEGILYHGYVVTKGGKWNWQGNPFKAVYGKQVPEVQTIAFLLVNFAQIRKEMRESLDPAIFASSRLSHLIMKQRKIE